MSTLLLLLLLGSPDLLLLHSLSPHPQAQMSAKQLWRAAEEAEERVAVEAARRAEVAYVGRVQAVVQQPPPTQWHGLRKHEW